MKYSFFAIIFLLLCSGFVQAPEQDTPPTTVSHAAWNALLTQYVSSAGKVNYQGMKASQAKLETYLATLQKGISSSASKGEKMAFWINAYNAFTVKLIVDNYPVKSIKDLKGGKPWDAKFVNIGGKSYSLNNIEHDILRANYFDPRLHFVLVCAAKSCPKLLNKAYTAGNLGVEMTNQAKYFINNPAKNKISANSAQVSKLFDWYKGDFTKSGSLVSYLNKYANTKLSSGAKITHLTYDWSLNN